MDRPIDRRQALKLLTGVAVTSSFAGCTSEKDKQAAPTANNSTTTQTAHSSPTPTTTPIQTQTQTSTQTPTETPTQTSTETSTPTTTPSPSPTPTNSPTQTETKTKKGTTVSFKSSDGRTVSGTLYGSGSCVAVFAPGSGYDRTAWSSQALAVAKAGHAALTVDLNADSSYKHIKTLVGASSYLQKQQNAKTIVFVGAGSGATAVVKANTVAETNIAGSVIIAPGRAVAYAPDLSGRLLFVVGKNDDTRYVKTTKSMYKRASEPKRLVTLPTAKHGMEILNTKLGSKLTNLIVTFVETTCSKSK